ncbi:hypothetical protein [Kingella sp. (in: b-proteobacteria)]|uniref:hypothetical protein n=1 Tax=Kingella sp. (in: b-proteobacteria) TaxID=2020713 RepID=UPI0026DB9276|nr:hypothetical protein [Kingella sp. (in: b-proteobacteria)]MDO4657375.1 hypothetical protein [Kingella sp. (in: b-proteobacteria)]
MNKKRLDFSGFQADWALKKLKMSKDGNLLLITLFCCEWGRVVIPTFSGCFRGCLHWVAKRILCQKIADARRKPQQG